jgi:hypothetical protein
MKKVSRKAAKKQRTTRKVLISNVILKPFSKLLIGSFSAIASRIRLRKFLAKLLNSKYPGTAAKQKLKLLFETFARFARNPAHP